MFAPVGSIYFRQGNRKKTIDTQRYRVPFLHLEHTGALDSFLTMRKPDTSHKSHRKEKQNRTWLKRLRMKPTQPFPTVVRKLLGSNNKVRRCFLKRNPQSKVTKSQQGKDEKCKWFYKNKFVINNKSFRWLEDHMSLSYFLAVCSD